MQDKKYSLVVLFILFFATGSLFAQISDQAEADVTITLQKGLSITAGGDLDFGEQVILSSDENISASSPVNILVTGEPSKAVDFTFPTTVSLTGSGGSLTFTTLLEETGATTSHTSGSVVSNSASETIAGDGTLNLWLGGSILVPSSANSGLYTGTFNITVAY